MKKKIWCLLSFGVFFPNASHVLVGVITFGFMFQTVRAQDNLALTPPMGFNSWNLFAQGSTEKDIQGIADAMVQTGMRDLGYKYIMVEEFYAQSRDDNGNLAPDPRRFPSGMKALGDYIHARGLKFGVYQDAGGQTCAGGPGVGGNETGDANLFASWGVDYLKYDYCHAPEDSGSAHKLYSKMSAALKAIGRPFLFGICEWGQRKPWLWARNAGGNMWRTTLDVQDTRYGIDVGGYSWVNMLEQNVNLAPYAGPGGWNDPDMLVVGLYGKGALRAGGESDVEYQSQMSLWCMIAAPLFASNDLRAMNQATKDILLNPEIIAVDQDSLGSQGTRVMKTGEAQVWKKNLRGGDLAVCLFNHGNDSLRIRASWSTLGITGTFKVRDLWAKMDAGLRNDSLVATLPAHGSKVYRMTLEGSSGISVRKPPVRSLLHLKGSSGFTLDEQIRGREIRRTGIFLF